MRGLICLRVALKGGKDACVTNLSGRGLLLFGYESGEVQTL